MKDMSSFANSPTHQFTNYSSSLLELHHRHAAPALLGRRGGESRHERMLLQKPGQRPFQLACPVPMDEANDAPVGQERFVEEALRARNGFIHRAPDHIEIRPESGAVRAGRLAASIGQLDVDTD